MLLRVHNAGVCKFQFRGLPSRASIASQAIGGRGMSPGPVRNLHYVFKIGDRKAADDFLQSTLLMNVLRHEEFTEGCAAACNGPYDGRWSKTMMGYASEDDSFALELTYNYNVKSYDVGNDFNSLTISSKKAFETVKASGSAIVDGKAAKLAWPEGHQFIVINEDVPGPNPVTEVALNVSDLKHALMFWSGFLGFAKEQEGDGFAVLRPAPGQTSLRLQQLPTGTKMDRGTGYGRIAFACPGEQLQSLEADVQAAGYTVHTPYVSLDTPGKATVQVVILQDPDGHEICFVGDAGFRDLSQVDPDASRLLAEQIAQDKSTEWAEKQRAREAAMAAKGV